MGSNVRGRKIRINEIGASEEVINEDIEKRIKPKKIRINYSAQTDVYVVEDEKLDRELENEDNMSLAMMIFILVMCLIVGICVGYLLYRLAINSSNVLIIK